MRSQWQIDQGKACGCRGHDEYCGCQNVNRSEPDEYPPSPEMACRERADQVKANLRDLLNRQPGLFAGYREAVVEAIKEIDDLAESYLACCADNDRLRALVENQSKS